ncbi:MAG TPA: UbiA family prenyltransferase, partial [Acidimicrobiales bacterium]|nr:UbiA family prenyltransferase [Acidimicrobiales bacterium]
MGTRLLHHVGATSSGFGVIDRAGPRLHARWRQSPAAHPTPTASDAVASPPPAIDRPNRDRPRPATSRARGALAATRPRQWLKNLLVFAAPGAAGLLGRSAMLGRTAIAAGLFLVASAGTYLVNDAVDVAADRLHPEKSLRPVAAGVVDRSLALSFGGALLLLAIVGAAVFEPVLAVVIGAYVLTTTTYTLWLKRVAVIELACVSAGFVLRAVAGGVAVHIAIS